MAHLQVEAVSKVFGTSVRAVRRLSFEVADREFVFLLGPSGAGKTTTLRMIAGLEQPTEGRILIDRRDMTWAAPRDRNVAMVYDKNSLYPHLSAFENMAYPLRLRKMPETELRARIARVADILQLGHLVERSPRQLSGGQQQRVAIGRMLVRDASLYLMDEPISHLDAKLRSHMRLEFKKLQREFAATILYVSHDQLEAMTMGDRIIVINAGTIQQIGPPREIFESPANRFVAGFVGEPAMNFLPCNLEMSGGRSAIVGNGFRIATEPALLERLGTLRRAPGGLEIGLRPQHLALAAPAESASDDVLAGTIYAIEALGSATIFDVSVGNRIVRVQAKQNSLIGRNFQIGEPVGVRVDRHLVYLFDEFTGKTVSQPGSSAGRPPEASKLAG